MRDIVRTNDPVAVSFIVSLLTEAEIAHHVADQHMSIMEGSIGAFPRRIQVPDDEVAAACELLVEAGLGAEILPDALRLAKEARRG